MAALVESSECVMRQPPAGLAGKQEQEVVPPSLYHLAQDWNQYFVEVGDWLVR